jgi:hypothetical protein
VAGRLPHLNPWTSLAMRPAGQTGTGDAMLKVGRPGCRIQQPAGDQVCQPDARAIGVDAERQLWQRDPAAVAAVLRS